MPGAAAAQTSSPVASALRAAVQSMGRNLIAAADDMPADKYGFKPTPPQMSFGQVILHLAQGNEFMCSSLAGNKAPDEAKLAPEDPKDKLVPRLKRSFEFCNSAVASMDDSKLADSVPFFGGRKVPRATMVMTVGEDYADHYSQLAIYMRLNGLLPPTARK